MSSSFRSIYAPALGIGPLSTPCSYRSDFLVFQSVSESNSEPSLSLSTYTGAFLGSMAMDVLYTILSSIEFRYGVTGSIDCKFELNSESDIPLVRFTDLVFYIGPVAAWRGYIWSRPGPDKKAGDSWKYSGKGTGSRLEKVNIALKENKDFYEILSILHDDETNTSTIFVSSLFTIDIVGRVCILQDSEDSNNDGRYEVIDAGHDSGGDYIAVINPAGIVQSLSVGTIYILPEEWSDPSTKLSDLVKQVVTEYCDDLPISQTLDFIEECATITGDVVDLDKMSVDEFFKQIRLLAPDYELFVNSDAQVVFRKKSIVAVEIALAGYDFHNVENSINEDKIVNRWRVNSKEGKESSFTGFSSGGFAQDLTSIKNIGVQEESEDVPVYYGDSLKQALAEALLEQSVNPSETVTVKNAPFDYYKLGIWKIIMQPRPQESVLSECEILSDWTASSPSIIDLSIESSNVVFGAGALKAEYNSAATDGTVTFDTDFIVIDPQYFRLWYRGTRIGQKVIFGFGESDFLENTFEIYVYSTRWKRFDIPMEGIDIKRIKKIGYKIGDAHDGDQFLIDGISIFSTVSNHKLLELIEVRVVAGTSRFCDLTFGTRPSRLDDFMAGIFRSANMTRLALRT